ncbi:hypothetical protein BP6252_08132 [Coleophoma cylindrospora]|uniref:Uncharacterized protein n=1 Tax=Coleophoma cylindrospora TaxID=1849047 RepID=A0A3D8RBY3_9HELO|nr:hypothetical protein BP6252_08132 [Coleophoma cylindrospora]
MLSDNESEPFLEKADNVPSKQPNIESVQGALNNWGSVMKRLLAKFTSLRISGLLVFVATSLFWAGVLLMIQYFPRIHKQATTSTNPQTVLPLFQNLQYVHCGRSNADAKALGCRYDILSNHWVPQPCMDQGAVEEYQSDGSWFGFADEDRTQLLSIDAMSEMPVYYTNERDHIVHCAMLWRKQFRAFAEGRGAYDSIIADERHTMHCSEYLINMTDWAIDFRTMPIKVFVGYAGCYLEDYK